MDSIKQLEQKGKNSKTRILRNFRIVHSGSMTTIKKYFIAQVETIGKSG